MNAHVAADELPNLVLNLELPLAYSSRIPMHSTIVYELMELF